MIVPFRSWNLSDTTHVRSHTKFQLIWAINTAYTREGLNQPPPLTQMCSWDPLTIRVNKQSSEHNNCLVQLICNSCVICIESACQPAALS